MSNPYEIINRLDLPGDCISYIMSFYRPKHHIITEMKDNFVRCGVCKDPVRTYSGKIKLRYYGHRLSCVPCCVNGCIVCKDCPVEDSCDCSEDSWYSWFSF